MGNQQKFALDHYLVIGKKWKLERKSAPIKFPSKWIAIKNRNEDLVPLLS
jgi:hypothetical protein